MDTEKLIEESSPELEAEMRRIRNLFGPPSPHDREDLVSYAKRVLRLVKRSSALEASTRRVKELEEALGDVLNPLGYLKREAEREGNKLNGMAYAIASDPALAKQIARDALRISQEGL